jgi:hypothetical protein
VGILLLIIVATGLGGGAWVASRLFQRPPDVPVPGSAADGQRAQQKIYDIGRARRSAAHGPETVVITEGELNAFLSRHVIDAVDVPLADLAVRMVGDDDVQIYGRTTLRGVLADAPLSNVIAALPARWQRQNIWLRFDGKVRVESPTNGNRRLLRIDLERLWVGRQPLPAICARLAFDPTVLGLLRWRLPARLEAVSIEPGRAIIRPPSAR